MKRFICFLLGALAAHWCFAQAAQPNTMDALMQVNAEWQHQADARQLVSKEPAAQSQSFHQWIATHLRLVEKTLRQRSTAHLTETQAANRAALLDQLHGYWQQGLFPVNDYLTYKNPVFIDRAGTHCAVGYLMQQSGAEALARQIDREQKFAYVHEIKTPGVAEWASTNGFTLNELAWIQPGYPPTINPNDLDKGLNGDVYALTTDQANSVVYAAGNFTATRRGVPCAHIAAWVSGFAGWSWISLGSGLNGPVYCLLWHDNKLYAGGNFTMAGGVSAKNIAAYNIGTGQWEAVGALDSTVRSLAVYNNQLYAAGNFTGFLSKWNGSQWQDIANGFLYGEGARTLAVWNNMLVVGGSFELATGALRKHVAVYDGTYMSALSMGTLTPVNDFEVHNNALYAACDAVSGNDTCALARYDNDHWQKVLGISMGMFDAFSGKAIYKMKSVNGQLICAGDFMCSAGMTYGNHLMAYSRAPLPGDTTLRDITVPLLTTDLAVRDVMAIGNVLYFGGDFVVNSFTDTLQHVGYFALNPAGITSAAQLAAVRVFPNPATTQITIETSNGISLVRLELIGADGALVATQEAKGSAASLSLKDMASGAYKLRVYTDAGIVTKPVIKSR
ncbi:MAG: T9SS type A sorting domain-containing protein [Chitinophagales bacterium]